MILFLLLLKYASPPIAEIKSFKFPGKTGEKSFASDPVVRFARPSFQQFREVINQNKILNLENLNLKGPSRFDILLYVIKGKKFFGIGDKVPVRIFAQTSEVHHFQRNIYDFSSNEEMFRVFEGLSEYDIREKYSSFKEGMDINKIISILNSNKVKILEELNFIPRENFVDVLAVKRNSSVEFMIIDPRRVLVGGSFTNAGYTNKGGAGVDFEYEGTKIFTILRGKGGSVKITPTANVLQFTRKLGEQAKVIEMPKKQEETKIEVNIPQTIDAKLLGITMPEAPNAVKIPNGSKTIILKKNVEQLKKAVNESKKK